MIVGQDASDPLEEQEDIAAVAGKSDGLATESVMREGPGASTTSASPSS